ncbi:hypothetical protein, partial [Burkholderia mallei]|uniref:hypothetical protein n=1 Tax=Burkholderia mallei TaxID=13373 RepID=UPI00235DE512
DVCVYLQFFCQQKCAPDFFLSDVLSDVGSSDRAVARLAAQAAVPRWVWPSARPAGWSIGSVFG